MPRAKGGKGHVKAGIRDDAPDGQDQGGEAEVVDRPQATLPPFEVVNDPESYLDDPDLLEVQPPPQYPENMRGQRERNREAARKRMAQALQLRMGGATYDQIAQALKYADRAGAKKAVTSALKDITKSGAEDVRELELARLDRVLLAIWPECQKGSLNHIDRFIRLQHQRALLLGLYSPVKIAPTTPDGEGQWSGVPDDELVQQFNGLLESIRTRQAGLLGEGATAAGIAPDASQH